MHNFLRIAACVMLGCLSSTIAVAQSVPVIVVSPSAPASTDTITMQISGAGSRNYASSSRVTQENNRIRVVLGDGTLAPPIPLPPVPGSEFTYVELGKLPAGTTATPRQLAAGQEAAAAPAPVQQISAGEAKAKTTAELDLIAEIEGLSEPKPRS